MRAWTVLRWLLTVPSAAMGLLVAFFGATALNTLVEGWCYLQNPGYSPGINDSPCLGVWRVLFLGALGLEAAAAAVLVVLLPTLAAPHSKHWVALSFYALGALTALLLTAFIKAPLFLLAALAAGGLTLRWLWQRYAPKDQQPRETSALP
ncbi:MAG: hypothetical protein SFU83_22175 [Meiothermus sp.]|nr:hypothetical protein [Meiothermus sp.]